VQEVLLAVFGGIVLFFLLIGAAIDMAARIEYAQETFPRLRKLAENRKWRTVLLIATCLFYGGTLYELLKEPPAVPLVFTNPGAHSIKPIIQENSGLKVELAVLKEPEPDDSLRRRTIKLANDIENYVEARWAVRPPINFNDFQNQHASDDQKKAMQIWTQWNQEGYEYFKDHYKDQWVRIVKEYDSKGVKVGTLINDAEQYQPVQVLSFPFPPAREDLMCQLALTRFRELAYHVNADGSVVNIEPSR
jgi:hypothetical protein